MLGTNGVTVRFGKRVLYEDVNVKFTPGNCYGVIGANGAGKSTFLKVLTGDLEPSEGEVYRTKNERLGILKQDHYMYDEVKVIDTVIRGNERLYEIMQEKDDLYAKPDFNDEDGIRAGELEAEFAELNGWMADTDAAQLLTGLGIDTQYHECLMKELSGPDKVKVLLAQALFGNPDVLILDEPTNNLDMAAISWLEEFLINFENTVIVVSHDRYFLNKVCTHILDIDYGKINIFVGNYDFWYESSQLALKQMKDANKKKEEKIKELEEFIRRFSANASKSKQATSRKKTLEKIELDEIKPSTRRYPFIDFKPEREAGKDILSVEDVSLNVDGEQLLKNVSFKILKGDKIAIVGGNGVAKTALFKIIMGEIKPDTGKITFGQTIKPSYIPQDNDKYFKEDKSIVQWIADDYGITDETVVRSFLGRMLFSGDEALKKIGVLSGGEKARCMMARAMLEAPNLLFLDEPTNHLDLESITALNEGLIRTNAELVFVSHDHQFVQTIANRIIEITEDGIIDKRCTYDEYLEQHADLMKKEKSISVEE